MVAARHPPATTTNGPTVKILWCSWKDTRHRLAGGAEVWTANVTRALAAAGHEVTLACAAVPGAPSLEVVEGVTIRRSGGALQGVYSHARSWYDRTWSEWDLVVDEVNTRPFGSPRWVRGTLVVAVVHQVAREVWFHEAPLPVAVLGRYLLEPLWLRRYHDTPVACVSESTAASLHGYGVRRTVVIGEGGEVLVRSRVPERAPAPTVLFVGRLAQMKRPLDVVEAHRKLRVRRPDLQTVFIGDGPLAGEIAALGEPGVQLLGRVDDGVKLQWMQRAWALAATGVREGWGLVISEAAGCGTFAVGYDVPGLRDSLGATGGVICEPTPSALAEALDRHLDRLAVTAPATTGTVPWMEVAERLLVTAQDAPR